MQARKCAVTTRQKGIKEMERTAVFTITEHQEGYDIKCKAYENYNQYNVPKNCLFSAMCVLADIFNNNKKIGICFDVE